MKPHTRFLHNPIPKVLNSIRNIEMLGLTTPSRLGYPTVQTDRGRLLVDSGTESTILFDGSAGDGTGRVRTASGVASVSGTRAVTIRVAGRPYRTDSLSVPRRSFGVDGLVPAHLFRAIYVSNSGKHMVLDPAK